MRPAELVLGGPGVRVAYTDAAWTADDRSWMLRAPRGTDPHPVKYPGVTGEMRALLDAGHRRGTVRVGARALADRLRRVIHPTAESPRVVLRFGRADYDANLFAALLRVLDAHPRHIAGISAHSMPGRGSEGVTRPTQMLVVDVAGWRFVLAPVEDLPTDIRADLCTASIER